MNALFGLLKGLFALSDVSGVVGGVDIGRGLGEIRPYLGEVDNVVLSMHVTMSK